MMKRVIQLCGGIRRGWREFSLLVGVFLLACASTLAQGTPAPPEGAKPYQAELRPTDGAHLALTVRKLEEGFDPPRPFLIWALGSSYTNMLGDGTALISLIQERFPNAPPIVYKKMVGNSVPWQYLRGWARHLVVPEQPDLVLIYTIGEPAALDALLQELRRGCTADIIVPSIHWRERDIPNWGRTEDAADQEVAAVRAVCQTYGVEFVESRSEWAQYLKENQLEIPDLLRDAVHQSEYGAQIINMNIARHIHRASEFAYDPESRERRLNVGEDAAVRQIEDALTISFEGRRIDLIGCTRAGGGTVKVKIDGRPADEYPAFHMTYVEPGKQNYTEQGRPPRDLSPHGITLGDLAKVVPQCWTIAMTSDDGDYRLSGSETGPDGEGNARQLFKSDSGQIIIEPELWRRSEYNKTDDMFSFEVGRSTQTEVDFAGVDGQKFRVTLASDLPNARHVVQVIMQGEVDIKAFDVFQPPLR